jgi:hypothetical protein
MHMPSAPHSQVSEWTATHSVCVVHSSPVSVVDSSVLVDSPVSVVDSSLLSLVSFEVDSDSLVSPDIDPPSPDSPSSSS